MGFNVGHVVPGLQLQQFGDFLLNLERVHSPSPWGEILKLQCGARSTSKSVSIPRPLCGGVLHSVTLTHLLCALCFADFL
jgi:hypothetical protein